MAKNIQGLKRVSLFNPANGDTVLLSQLSPDSTYEKTPIQTETGDGAIQGGYEQTAETIFFDLPDGARTLLESWENDHTEVNLVAITGTGALLWYHPTEVTGFIDSLATNARDGVSPFTVRLTTVAPYADIAYGINIFRAAIKRTVEGRNAIINEQFVSARQVNEDSGEYLLNPTSTEYFLTVGQANNNNVRIIFPMPNINLFFGAVGDSGTVVLTTNSFAGAMESSTIMNPSSNQNVELVTGSGAYTIRISSSGILFEQIYLRHDAPGYTSS